MTIKSAGPDRDGLGFSGLREETRFVACFSRINSVLLHVSQDSGVTGNIQFVHVGIWSCDQRPPDRPCTYALVDAFSQTLGRGPYACSDATSTGLCSSGHETQFSEKCAISFRNSDTEFVRMRGEHAYACRCVLGCVRGRGACACSVCVCVCVRECVRVRIPYATPEGVPATLIARECEPARIVRTRIY